MSLARKIKWLKSAEQNLKLKAFLLKSKPNLRPDYALKRILKKISNQKLKIRLRYVG